MGKILADYGMETWREAFREYYGGYNCGSFDVYNPLDVLRAVSDYLESQRRGLPFWLKD